MSAPHRCHDSGVECSVARVLDEVRMTDVEYSRKLEELDRLLNDPTVPMQPDRIWSLLEDVSGRKAPSPGYKGQNSYTAS
jgi:hypothetical protein